MLNGGGWRRSWSLARYGARVACGSGRLSSQALPRSGSAPSKRAARFGCRVYSRGSGPSGRRRQSGGCGVGGARLGGELDRRLACRAPSCGVSRFAVRRVMRGPVSGRGRAATAGGPPATGASPGARPLGLLGREPARDRFLARVAGLPFDAAAQRRGSSPRPPAARRAPAPRWPGRARSTGR